MHTKEPWFYGGTEVSTKEDLLRIFSESIDSHVGKLGQYFMEVYTEDGKRVAFIAGPTAHDNALRVSACVNACAGIETEIIERNVGNVWKLLQHRDELLAALKEVRKWIGDGEFSDDTNWRFWSKEYSDIVRHVDEVITKADLHNEVS